MRDVLGPGTTLGYCTNVHGGTTLEQIKANLQRYAVAVRRRVSPASPMGVGLWLPASAARALAEGGEAAALGAWLARCGLEPYTINGFPYGDFHRAVVKHEVYRPSWARPQRLAYTIDLIEILAALLPPGAEGSISTLPVGWRGDFAGDGDALARGADHLREAAAVCARIEGERGVRVHVDLEPEPGCCLERGADVVRFFEEYLCAGTDGAGGEAVRRHLGVCHDVCHAAVMFEPQREVLARYRRAGIAVGKLQVSSALRVPMETMSAGERQAARRSLASFAEPRYLHQTMIRRGDGRMIFHDDLPAALAASGRERGGDGEEGGEWRVHYHVPLFLEHAGPIATTAPEIAACLELPRSGRTRHVEVETYAWDVLPAALRPADLAEGIAAEMRWLVDLAGTGARR